jgi:hypothetical protein
MMEIELKKEESNTLIEKNDSLRVLSNFKHKYVDNPFSDLDIVQSTKKIKKNCIYEEKCITKFYDLISELVTIDEENETYETKFCFYVREKLLLNEYFYRNFRGINIPFNFVLSVDFNLCSKKTVKYVEIDIQPIILYGMTKARHEKLFFIFQNEYINISKAISLDFPSTNIHFEIVIRGLTDEEVIDNLFTKSRSKILHIFDNSKMWNSWKIFKDTFGNNFLYTSFNCCHLLNLEYKF